MGGVTTESTRVEMGWGGRQGRRGEDWQVGCWGRNGGGRVGVGLGIFNDRLYSPVLCSHLNAFCVHHTTMHHVTSCKATYVRCMRV